MRQHGSQLYQVYENGEPYFVGTLKELCKKIHCSSSVPFNSMNTGTPYVGIYTFERVGNVVNKIVATNVQTNEVIVETLKEFSERISIDDSWIRRKANEGKIVGGVWLVKWQD